MPSNQRKTPRLRIVNGYWVANPVHGGKRRTWSMGPADTVTQEQAAKELRERLSRAPEPSNSDCLTVQRLAELFLSHAETIYVRADGTQTGEAKNLMYGLQPLIDQFGTLDAALLKPRHVAAFATAQTDRGVSRQTINKRIGMIKRMLKWGAEHEHVPTSTYDLGRLASTLKAGRGAREAKAIRAVPIAQVEQTLPFLANVLQTMIRLQLITAMRPEEVCAMRLVDITLAGSVWVYVPAWHKNKHRGQERRIHLGPKAQELLRPFMVGKALEDALFSPREAVRERRGKLPRTRIGHAYDTRSYRKAIWYAADKAFPMPEGANRAAWLKEHRWSPNRLRKLCLDNIEREHGKQAAKAYAGHSRVETTQDFYLSQNDSLARSVAEKVG